MSIEGRRAADILSAHADHLIDPSASAVDAAPDELSYLRPLMELAERLRCTMVPVEPSATFVQSLGRELIEAARRRQAATQRLRRGIVIGAAALGSALSLAGLVALVLVRRRARPHPRPSSGPVVAAH